MGLDSVGCLGGRVAVLYRDNNMYLFSDGLVVSDWVHETFFFFVLLRLPFLLNPLLSILLILSITPPTYYNPKMQPSPPTRPPSQLWLGTLFQLFDKQFTSM